ncbi:MAG: hypothetical protein ACFFBD_00390 [Candidatus Hodarchaeota archaeon]
MEERTSVLTNAMIIASLGIALMEFIPIIGGGKSVFIMSGDFVRSGTVILEILTTGILENLALVFGVSVIWAVNGCAAGVRSKRPSTAFLSCLLGLAFYLFAAISLISFGPLISGLLTGLTNPALLLAAIRTFSQTFAVSLAAILDSLISFGSAIQFSILTAFSFALITARFMMPEKEEEISYRRRGKIWRDEEMWLCKKCTEFIPPGVLECPYCGERVLD